MKTTLLKNIALSLLCFAFSAVSFTANAESVDQQKSNEKVLYQETFHFKLGYGQWIDPSDYSKADALVEWAKANSEGIIDIKGWSDTAGSSAARERMAFNRARTIRNYLVQNGIDSSRIEFKGMGVDTASSSSEARRAEVVISVAEAVNPTPAVQPKKEEVKEAVKEEVAETKEEAKEAVKEEVAESTSDAANKAAAAAPVAAAATAAALADPCKFDLRTNLLYWPAGLANLGLEWQPANTRLGIVLNGGISPFNIGGDNLNLGGWFVSPEIRYYLGKKQQWFVGAQFLTGGYDIKVFDFLSTLGREGTVNCYGLMGGYKLKLSDTFDMDFTLGLGCSSFKCDSYHLVDGEKETYATGIEMKKFTPIQAGVNLIWKLKK